MKKVVQKICDISYILIFISAVLFVSTIVFRNKANAEMELLQMQVADLQLQSLQTTTAFTELQAEGLRSAFVPYTYYNFNLEQALDDLINTLMCSSTPEEKLEKIVFFQHQLQEYQRKIQFCFDSLIYGALFLALIGVFSVIVDMISKSHEIKRLQAINESQMKFSRDLHDGVAQDLYAMKLYMDEKDDGKSTYYADKALKEVRYLIDYLHLDLSESFERILETTLSTFENNFGIKCHLFIGSSILNDLDYSVQNELLYILNEVLSNIARHAEATDVQVKFTDIGHDLRVVICDNGKGFDEETVAEKNSTDTIKHHGLENIRTRVHNLNGTVEITTKGGTTIGILLKNTIR